jgi:negative regulator of sigma E activity
MKAMTEKQSNLDHGINLAALNPDERVAALADSALSEADAQTVIDALLAAPELRTAWHRVHRTADYLRSEDLASCDASTAFWEGLSVRLEQEPTLLAPRAKPVSTRRVWLRYGFPGISVAAAVAMVSWLSFPQLSGKSDAILASNAPLSQSQAQSQFQAQAQNSSASDSQSLVAGATPEQVVLDASVPTAAKPVDARQLRNYLAAHQQFSASALRGPVAVHSASFNIIRGED